MIIQAQWPAPANIKAFTSVREGGVSLSPFDSLNLATHVGDNESLVLKNRSLLKEKLDLPSEPCWLNQTHSTDYINLDHSPKNFNADASYTSQKNTLCAILTADCLPILICNNTGTIVAAIHAGWRGLAGNIIRNVITALPTQASGLLAWLGPAIGPQQFEVGEEVVTIFVNQNINHEGAFVPSKNGRWMCNIYSIAKQQLQSLGVTHIYGGDYCTYSDAKNFYSYRRDGASTGRMASIIWMA